MADLLMADVSEFQPGIDWAAYGAANPAVIVRAHNGGRADKLWTYNAAGAFAHCRWVGVYQYLRAGDDPAAAARALRATIGDRHPNVTILDLEEGAGDQQPRQHAWLSALADDDITDWTYAGDYFARSHGLTTEWVAAYQQREPSIAHVLWQNTDRRTFAGIAAPCDGSIFHGTISDLIALTGRHTEPAPAPPVQEDNDMNILYQRGDGDDTQSFLLAGDKLVFQAAPEVYKLVAKGAVHVIDHVTDKSWNNLVHRLGDPDTV